MLDQEILQAVKDSLTRLVALSPGRAIEVRIPPYAVVQCGDGPTHARGTPPNIVEMDASTWLAIANGSRTWKEAMQAGEIRASGARADLSRLLPLEIG